MDARAERQLEIFEKAVGTPPELRAAFLDEACGSDKELRQEVERLLQAHDSSGILDQTGSSLLADARRQVRQTASEIEGILEKPGDMLGQYRLRRLLGEGGFGAVFLADQQGAITRQVALKIIKPGMDTRPVIARFETERQALALMEHPGIAKVFDAGATSAGRPYFVMEYVQGTSITRYCDENRLGLRERLELIVQAARAVHHAHQKGIIHRDLKPGNILVGEAGGEAVPKVIDFGIAKAIRQPLTDSTLMTHWGQVIGTPQYMSPEQSDGTGLDVDTRTDVFSLGVVLYKLLTGVLPCELPDRSPESLRQALQKDPPRPSQRLGGLPADEAASLAAQRSTDPATLQRRLRSELDWIVLKAIDRDRSRRYDSMAALAADVQAYLDNQPVQAKPPSATYRLSKFAGRHKVWLSAASVALAALLVGLALAILGFVEAGRERDAARLARDEAEAVAEFLSGMLASADPAEQGRDVSVVEVLERSSAGLSDSFADRPLLQARLQHTIGRTYWSLGRYDAARRHLEAALNLRNKGLGPNHPATLGSLASLAGVLYEQGLAAEAEPLFLQALESFRKGRGEEGAAALGVMNNLAQIYSSDGRLQEAEQLQRRVLELQTKVLGADHPHTLGSRLNLAGILSDRGKSEEGMEMIRLAWEDWKRAHGETHPGTLMALQNLANAHLASGDLESAERLGRQAWTGRRQALGETHPDTWNSQFNLSVVLSQLKRFPEAEALLRGIVQAPPEAGYPPVRSQAAVQLLSVYQRQGWPRQERDFLESAFAVLRHLAHSPRSTPGQLNDAAWFLMQLPEADLRDYPLALQAAQRACEKERQRSGQNLWMYLDTLALSEHKNGQSRKAVETQQQALSLIPESGQSFRAEMEGHLAEFQKAAGN